MLKEEIVVGKSYVNEGACILREIVEEVDSRHVRYNAFELESGRLLPARHRVCSTGEMQRWADRQAEACETDRIHPFDPDGSADGAWWNRSSMDPEQARAAADAAPGAHTFPILK
jgi:hypothetical protein